MLARNNRSILEMLNTADVVLDIGGWACPFNRANYVMDAEPYETRGYYGTVGLAASQGGDREYFNQDRWIRRDICAREPYPFADKELDFVICSHTLEDIRDPLWVCAEMLRIAKAGYIEVPSRKAETCRGWESPRLAGLSHHRWLIDIDTKENAIQFMMKYHMIHSHWRFSFPTSFLPGLSEEERVSWLCWKGDFKFAEVSLHGLDRIAAELEQYVQRHRPYPAWQLKADQASRNVAGLVRRVARKVARV